MSIAFDRERFTAAVAFAARALPRNAVHPALNGIRITATDGVTVSAFDYDTYAEANAGPSTAAFDLLLPGRVLASYLAGMTAPQVIFDVDGPSATITSGAAKVTLRTLNVTDYPSAPALPTSVGTLDAAALATAVGLVKACVGIGEGVRPLEGIRVEAVDGVLTFAGVSRYRLAARDLDWVGDGDIAATLPMTITDSVKAFDGDVVIGAQDGRVSLGDADRCLMVRTIDGEPPAWRRLLDGHTGNTRVDVDRGELVDAIRWVIAGDRDRKTTRVSLDVSDGTIGVALVGADSLDASTYVAAKVDGDGVRIGFSPAYLLDGLAAADAATVTITLGSPTKAALVTADTDPGFRALVMPVKLA